MKIRALKNLFREYTGESVETIREFPAAGSNRQYFRLQSMHYRVVGVWGTSPEENRAFVYLSAHFRQKGLPVPEVYVFSEDGMAYLQEDLGDILLFDALSRARETGIWGEEERRLLKKTMQELVALQCRGVEGLNFSRCYPLPEFNRRSVMWDLNYFKYCFLKTSGLEFQENCLEDDFEALARLLLQGEEYGFMYRDFQSRNVMICDGNPYFIDYQGGRKGPLHYDVASFVWQARARYPSELQEELLTGYLEALRQYRTVDEVRFRKQLRHFVLFRFLQVLGAYGFRGYFEKKQQFIRAVPLAIENLKEWLREEEPAYPYLCRVLRQLTGLKRYEILPERKQLQLTVYSFAYPRGIPEDTSGNGGGFVFDCRAIHNPGKYEPYKALTGRDEPVIHFLEEEGGILRFLEEVYALVDASVERYLQRGFTHLMVSFGCTGGQHRSVYAAQHLAEHIYRKFGIKVHLIHREQQVETDYI